jgi:hypothetical protein
MKNGKIVLPLLILATLPLLTWAQSPADTKNESGTAISTTVEQKDDSATATSKPVGQMDLTYVRPTQKTMAKNFFFDTVGPYPFVGVAVVSGINQATNTPPEWNQGVEGYAKRFGSNFGIELVSNTTRYGLSAAFKQDALYYRCDCTGTVPRLRHAMISTLTARKGADGHRVFSVPALVGPYAGSMVATYGWFPNRYGAKDAFRTGNYSLLTYMAGNIALEFFYSTPHSLLHRLHLNNRHGSPEPGPNN